MSPESAKGVVRAAAATGSGVLTTLGPLEAAVATVRALEDDGRFNAGVGSVPRPDGRTVEMDAACATSDGCFGAVAGLRDVANPVLVARRVLATPHVLLAGEGANAFAAAIGLPPKPGVPEGPRRVAQAAWAEACSAPPPTFGWTPAALRSSWNYEASPPECDTVGALATDGRTFAAAASTGGLSLALRGRVSDVALPGCGIHAGPAGAVAVTGQGDWLARRLAASSIYRRLEQGMPAQEAAAEAVAEAPPDVPVGVLALDRDGLGGASNRSMPWASAP